MKRDYYEILQVSRDCDEAILKKAFRKLAFEFHPDRNADPAATEKFREAQEAYDVLSSPEKRQIYDQFGHEGLSGRGYGGPSGFQGMDDIFSGFQTIFEDFFGGNRAESSGRGSDLLYRLEIDFREAVLGTTKVLEIHRKEKCETCEGSGCQKGKSPETCSLCKGRGQISRNQGFFVLSQTCPQCRGAGSIIKYPCEDCSGIGRKEREASIEVQVPAGVDTGVRLRIQGEGEAGERKAARGDLYVELSVTPDDVFERDGTDLYTQIQIPYPVAVLGGEIEVPLVEGTTNIKIPEAMSSPHRVSLKGEGVKDLKRNRRGDLIVEVHIEVPKKLSAEAKRLIEELNQELSKEEGSSKAKAKKKKRGFFH